MNLAGKRVLVLGLGESGLACALWCLRQGASLRVADTRAAPPYLAELNRRVTGADSCIEFRSGEFSPELLGGVAGKVRGASGGNDAHGKQGFGAFGQR